jgi:hypothetical protein
VPWLIALNVLMYVGAGALFFTGYLVWAAICFILAALLTLSLSGGSLNLLDDIF